MPKYEAEFEINEFGDDLGMLIEGLRAFGHPKLVFRVEAKNRAEACAETANELSIFWPRYDENWFQDRLKAIRGKRADEEI